MKIKSIKYNIFMNFIRVIFGMLFPLIIMPYINRTFEAKLIGEIEYSTTIVAYFVLLAGLGISTYGVREIAKIREDVFERSKFLLEMSIILFFTNIGSYIFLFFILYLEILKNINLKILYLISLNIVFTSFSFEWFYQGIENQEYITKRSVMVRLISILLIFLFVKSKGDIYRYVAIVVGSLVFSNIFNIINLKKYIKVNKVILKNIKLKKHLKSLFLMFGSSVAILIYSQIDILMIGDIVGTYYVGLYNISVKILSLAKVVMTIVGATLLPRLTNFYFSTSNEKYETYLKKTLNILILYSFYAALFIYINSSEIIYIFGGNDFKESIITLKIQTIIIPLSGLAYFYGVLVLYSQKKDKPFLYSVLIAALINLLLNSILIPKYNQNGAVIATIIAEAIVIFIIFILEKKALERVKFLNLNIIKIVSVGFLILIIEKNIQVNFFTDNLSLINIILKNIIIFSMYTFFLIFIKEEALTENIKIIKLKFSKSKYN